MKMGCKACEGGTCMEHGGEMKKMPKPAASPADLAMGEKPKGHKTHFDEGGEAEEADEDHDLHDAVASELMDAFHSKDKQGMLDALKALILSCKE